MWQFNNIRHTTPWSYESPSACCSTVSCLAIGDMYHANRAIDRAVRYRTTPPDTLGIISIRTYCDAFWDTGITGYGEGYSIGSMYFLAPSSVLLEVTADDDNAANSFQNDSQDNIWTWCRWRIGNILSPMLITISVESCSVNIGDNKFPYITNNRYIFVELTDQRMYCFILRPSSYRSLCIYIYIYTYICAFSHINSLLSGNRIIFWVQTNRLTAATTVHDVIVFTGNDVGRQNIVYTRRNMH